MGLLVMITSTQGWSASNGKLWFLFGLTKLDSRLRGNDGVLCGAVSKVLNGLMKAFVKSGILWDYRVRRNLMFAFERYLGLFKSNRRIL